MTPRTFWRILIKILGLWIVLDSFGVIMQFISTFVYINRADSFYGMIMILFLLIITAGVYFLILRYLIFKTDFIIDKLELDKGFTEEKFEINMHRSTILSIAVIVTGALIFVDTLPAFCRQIFLIVQQKNEMEHFKNDPNTGWIILFTAKLFISVLLMIYSRHIVNFIELKRKAPAENE